MIAEQLRALFQEDPNLPTLPDHVQRILTLLRDQDVPFPLLAKEIEKDPSLALRVVRLANSAAYGQVQDVTSLSRAFAVIGLGQMSSVLSGIVAVERCERFVDDSRFDWNSFWGHCSATAFIATSLTRRLGLEFEGAEFLGGLLHDIGYLALAKFGRLRFRNAVREAAEAHGFLSDGLSRRFGITVNEAGSILAEVSHLAPETAEVIRHHHDPTQAPAPVRPLVAVVSLANELAHIAGLTFFRGTAELEVVVTDLPAWALLVELDPRMEQWDVARVIFELEREYEASLAFVKETRVN